MVNDAVTVGFPLMRRRHTLLLPVAGLCAAAAPAAAFDVRRFGATGDGRTLDTAAINRAIAAAAAAGGGVVRVSAGTYLCYSIRLRSRVTLRLEQDAVIVGADSPAPGSLAAGYDPPEPNPSDQYQDFGHSHWHNSLIWGEGLHDVAITGPGRVWGRGLVRGWRVPGDPEASQPGVGNKAIALVSCRNVVLRGFSILMGGHFGILATGVEQLTIDNVTIDTNRDGMNVDCCRRVRISNCVVNSPSDDGICLKSSLALGERRLTEDVTITGCSVFGDYRLGTLLDGRLQPLGHDARAEPGWHTGRIKLGTESDGGFRNIVVTDCIFQSCRGLALETVDGGVLEDVTVSGLVMRDLRNAPLFLRLGARLRGPLGTRPGALRRVRISDVSCEAPRSMMPSIITGLPGHHVEDVSISRFSFVQKGGGMQARAAARPPEEAAAYPDPESFAPLPATGFFIRHARGLAFSHVEIACRLPDARSAFWLDDVDSIVIDDLRAPASPSGAVAVAGSVRGLATRERGEATRIVVPARGR